MNKTLCLLLKSTLRRSSRTFSWWRENRKRKKTKKNNEDEEETQYQKEEEEEETKKKKNPSETLTAWAASFWPQIINLLLLFLFIHSSLFLIFLLMNLSWNYDPYRKHLILTDWWHLRHPRIHSHSANKKCYWWRRITKPCSCVLGQTW